MNYYQEFDYIYKYNQLPIEIEKLYHEAQYPENKTTKAAIRHRDAELQFSEIKKALKKPSSPQLTHEIQAQLLRALDHLQWLDAPDNKGSIEVGNDYLDQVAKYLQRAVLPEGLRHPERFVFERDNSIKEANLQVFVSSMLREFEGMRFNNYVDLKERLDDFMADLEEHRNLTIY